MDVFELMIAESAVSHNGGPFVRDRRLTFAIPDEAEAVLERVLEPYGQSPTWYFDKVEFSEPPWALLCLDREYRLAGHLATARAGVTGISFTQYTRIPRPIPASFVPSVGLVVINDKAALETCAARSPIFSAGSSVLAECSSDRSWLAIIDSLEPSWVRTEEELDEQQWLAREAPPS